MRRFISYPHLFVTAIILDRVVISAAQIDIDQSLRVLCISLLFTTIALYAIQSLTKDWHYTNFITLMIPVALIAYRSFYGFLKVKFLHQADALGIALIFLFTMLYAVLVNRNLWRTIKHPAAVTRYFYIVFALLLGFQVVRLVSNGSHALMNITRPRTTAIADPTMEIHLQKGSSPDIYVIVLDGYARQDVLRGIYRYDNSKFIDWLEKRGFYVANNSHSNYTQTVYTMASFWNFDYLQPWDASNDYAQYLFQPIQNNRVFHALDEIGYTTVSFEAATSFIQIRNADLFLSRFLPLNKFETLLLADSPLEPLSDFFDLKLPIQTYRNRRQRMLYQFDTLKEVPASIQGPKIVYAHILAPHPPFVFDQAGNIREPNQPFTLSEGSDFTGGQEEYWDGYRGQVGFVDREITNVIEAILAKSETPPIIVLMGDHGPASMFNWNVEAPACLWERTSNLYAVLLPGHQSDGTVYPSITPVNTFRVIFNTYFGTSLPILEDNTYMMYPTLEVNVTGTKDSQKGCSVPDYAMQRADHKKSTR